MAPPARRPPGQDAADTASGSQDSQPTTLSTLSASSARSKQLRVLTLNVWGLRWFSKARAQRIPAIAARLAASHYDVVALQEIWCESTDWQALRQRCNVTFPYAKFFYTGAFGSGLAILSRYPIVSTHTCSYSLNGHPVFVHHGDWIVAKAAGCATIDVSGHGLDLGLVDFWVTHTVAAGGEDGPESRRAHRVAQAYELAQHARNSAEKGRHVVVLGDFNSTPPSLSMAILRDVGMLSDAFVEAHPDLPANATSLPSSDTRVRPDPRRAITELGITCDSPLNTWTAGKPLDERAKKGAGKRLDYVLLRGPVRKHADKLLHPTVVDKGRLRCVDSTVVFTELLEDLQLSLSDHFGVEAVFQIESQGSQDAPHDVSSRIAQTLTSAMSAVAAHLNMAIKGQRRHYIAFTAALLFALLAIIYAAGKHSSSNVPHMLWAALVLVCGWAGTTALYSAVIWGEWEKRSLRTFLEAMELDLATHRRSENSSQQAGAARAPPNRKKPSSQDAKLVQVD